ncbi:MAG: hypothetical protein HPY69_12375 [Armatimonadetes bacterium]|nr:hypothetical protein [Armatimonadota bacterium]
MVRWCHALVALVALGMAVPTEAQIPPRPKKLIHYGWSTRDTIYLRDHWQEMQEMPFDGLAVSVALDRDKPTVGDGATANLLGWNTFGATAYPAAQFAQQIADLQSVPRDRLRELFLPVCIASSGQDQGYDWFDDQRWATLLANWRSLVTIAREGGCQGLLLDVEHYDYGCELFCYRHHRQQRTNRPFADCRAQVRRRGRELMQQTCALYPDITVLMLYGWTLVQYDRAGFAGQPPEETRYSLLADFLDGMLEGSAPQTRFVDLWEFSYGYRERTQFLEGYHTVLNKALAVTSLPERYRAQVSCGFGLYLDNGSHWDAQDFAANYFSPEQFRDSLKLALELSDEYVWIYQQTPGFFPPSNLPEAYLEAIRNARQPAVGG